MLNKIYSNSTADFIAGWLACMKYYSMKASWLSLTLYGRPVQQEPLELEMKFVVEQLTEKRERIDV